MATIALNDLERSQLELPKGDGTKDYSDVIHSVPSYKERSYKERLVEMLQSKEQRLVEI